MFRHKDQGPPSRQRNVKPDGTCGNAWVCEHRWKEIKNMAKLAAVADGKLCDSSHVPQNLLTFRELRAKLQ